MRRNIFIFSVLFALLALSCPCSAQTDMAEVTPITVGDLEKYRDFDNKEKWDFIIDFYKKNKEKGATDGEILNELLKLDAESSEDSSVVKILSDLGKRYQDIENFVKNAVEEININILEKNPGKTEFIVDLNDADTWENLKYFKIGKRNINDYLNLFRKDAYFSDSVAMDGFSAVLASCSDQGSGEVLMSFILFPKNGHTLLTQWEGEASAGIKIDFAGSENLEFDPIHFPFEKTLNINGRKAFGYDGKVYLPFQAKLKDKEKNGHVRAIISAQTCKDNICRVQTADAITYTTEKSSLEASGCTKIRQNLNAAPLSQKSGFQLKKAFFKKEKNGEVNLFIILDIPVFGGKNPAVLVKNGQGLSFSEPFISWDGSDMLLKIRLLKPEKLQKEARLTIDIGYPGRASEFTVTARLEQMPEKPFLSVFSFSIIDSLLAFLSGVKFLFFTPVLTALLMLGYQAAIVDRKTPEKTVSFYNGLGNMFYFWCAICLIFGIVWFFVLPADIFWGIQFLSPVMNFLFFLVFSGAALFVPKIFDDVTVTLISERFPRVFSVLKTENVREKAGVITGFVIGCLLFITPMTGMYYDIYVLLSRSVVLYSVLFAAGVSLPFLILSLYDDRAAAIASDERAQKLTGMLLPLPLYVQAVLLAVLVGAQAGLAAVGILAVLTALMVVCLKRLPFSKVLPALAMLVLIGIVFIPFFPNENDLNKRGGTEFNKTLLNSRIQEGKSVYLSVTESFCLSCHWNRLIMITQGAPREIQNGDLTVMRAGYKDPFVENLLSQGGKYGLPINIIFSPLYPEGKIISSVLNPWTAQEAVIELVKPQESAPDPQSAPEQNQPDPAVKDTN
mgnify:CR=1 FL=1